MHYSTLQLEPEQNHNDEEHELYHCILQAYMNPDSHWWDTLRVITTGYKPKAWRESSSSPATN